MENDAPASRRRLLPGIEAHAEAPHDLVRPDRSGPSGGRREARGLDRQELQAGQPLHVTVVCTGNSRRSILGATMGNIAAAYYGMPEVRFHSGGTAPTAFNPRTIAALKEIGVEVEPTGAEAPRGEPKTANPIYTVRWGQAGEPCRMEATEFSKPYSDPANPQRGLRRPDGLRRGRRGLPARQGGRRSGSRCPTSTRRSTTTALTRRPSTPSGATTSAG